MFFKKHMGNLRIMIFGMLVPLFFFPGCLPFSVKTGKSFVLERGDRVSILTCTQHGRYLVLLNPHDGVPFPENNRDQLYLIMTGEGEHVKTPSGEGRKFSHFSTPRGFWPPKPDASVTGYVILYENNQDTEINIKIEDGVASEFNGMRRLSKTHVLLDDSDVPVINEFHKARTAEQLAMIRNASGSIKGMPLRGILISWFVQYGLYSHDNATIREFSAFQDKHRVSSKPVARLYYNVPKLICRDIFKYKDADAITIVEDLEQAFNQSVSAPRFKGENFDFDRDIWDIMKQSMK